MRCENCGRPIRNAEMWKLGGDKDAPTSRSMQSLCWDCKTKAEQAADAANGQTVKAGDGIDADEKPARPALVA